MAAISPKLIALSERQLTTFGRRRTAYPIDMNLSEVVQSRLAINTGIVRRSPGAQRRANLDSVISTALEARGPVMLLGLPGSGKSMTIYQLARRAGARGLTPIILRATDGASFADCMDTVTSANEELNGVVLFLDGLDEGMALWRGTREPPTVLVRLLEKLPSVVTSRTRDFEESAQLDQAGITFASIFELEPWSIDGHFRRYIERLSAKKRLADTSLTNIVRQSPELSKIAARPLHARMLTFLYEPGEEGPPRNQRDLYSHYLQKLARVAEVSLTRRGCELPGGVMQVWKEIAWKIYVANVPVHDVTRLLASTGLIDAHRMECGIAALDFIADRQDSSGYQTIEYLHYSFYEWLVAAHVRDHITSTSTAADIAGLVKHDLPREMRHHLTNQLSSAQQEIAEDLLSAYTSLRNSRSGPRETLIAGNLLIYLIARLSTSARSSLEQIEADEREPFLSNALLWSLCHLASPNALNRFLAKYADDEQWAEISRGYVLYYYGDLSRNMGPPYRDAAPYVSADRSIARVFSMLETQQYAGEIAAERQIVDILTILDIMSHRAQRLTNRQNDCLRPIVANLQNRLTSSTAQTLLGETFQKVSTKGSIST